MAGIRDALKKARMLHERKKLDSGSNQRPLTTNSSRFAYRIHSELLGKEIWFVSDERIFQEIKGDLAVYLMSELDYLVVRKASPDEIRKIHSIKEIFPGSKIVWQ